MILYTIHVTVDRKLNIRGFVAAFLALGLPQSPARGLELTTRFVTWSSSVIQLSSLNVLGGTWKTHLCRHYLLFILYSFCAIYSA